MKKYIKMVLFPLVLMVRVYRKFYYRPSAVVRSIFAYDRKRFARYAGCIKAEPQQASLARIIMAYHVLEKGLTMPRRHLDFGHVAVLNLIGLIEDFEKRFGLDDAQVCHAVGCVKEYLDLHSAADFDMSKDVDYWNRVKSFCAAHAAISTSRQIEMTRDAFFANNEAAFPVFAASRHTSRHYEGAIEINRIEEAVRLAMTAPSACNRQFVKVHCITSHVIRDAIFALQNGNRGFGSDADKLLVITADLQGNRWAEERNDLYTNAGMFIMNLCYSLHYERIAHCVLNWSVSPRNDKKLRDLIKINPSESVVALICCGNAPESFMIASSPRKNVKEILSFHG